MCTAVMKDFMSMKVVGGGLQRTSVGLIFLACLSSPSLAPSCGDDDDDGGGGGGRFFASEAPPPPRSSFHVILMGTSVTEPAPLDTGGFPLIQV